MTHDPKHVILISIDDLRFDAVRWQPDQRYWKALGVNARLKTPAMDALAEESVLFTKCLSNAGYTPLSHATLFTGSYAHRHGVVNFHNTTCRPQELRQSAHRLVSQSDQDAGGRTGTRRGVAGAAGRVPPAAHHPRQRR